MPSRLRVTSLAVLALAALPVVSACTTSPGAAAVIGSQRISVGNLQSQVDESLASGALQKQTGYDRTTFTRELLTHLISVDVLNAAAKDHGVTLTSKDIAAQMSAFVSQAGSLAALKQQAAQGGVAPSQLNGFVRFDALESKLGTELTSKLPATQAQLNAEYQKDIDQYDQVDIAQIEVKKKSLADNILSQVQVDPALFGSLASKYSIDTATASKGGEVGTVATSQVLKALGANATTLSAGSFAIAHVSGNYDVIHVISRHVERESAVTKQLKAALFSNQAQKLLAAAAQTEAKKLGVNVSPRYGKWDNTSQSVVATKSAISTPAASAPASVLSPSG